MKLSIVIPAYNEKDFILEMLKRLENVGFGGLEKEIIIVDDGSTDGTKEILLGLRDKYKIIFQPKNQGKGAALRAGFKECQGDIIAIQDADLEYNPADIEKLIEPIIKGQARVVYGSRMAGHNPIGHWRYYLGNKLISRLTNLLCGSTLTDVETGYKVFRRGILDNLNLESDDFGFEAEFTAKVLKSKTLILELPISYSPRRFDEGKKISWFDGVKAIWLLIKYRFKN